MPRDAVSRTPNAERNGGHKWVNTLRFAIHFTPGLKIDPDQAYSCPRDFPYHGGLIKAQLEIPPPLRSPRQYGTQGFKGRPRLVPYYAKKNKPLGQPPLFFPVIRGPQLWPF